MILFLKTINTFIIFSSQEEMEHKEKMAAGLKQTVQELHELLQAIGRQLTKRQERVRPFFPEVDKS